MKRYLNFSLIMFVFFASVSCVEKSRPAVDAKLLSTDMYLSVAKNTFVFPFLALGNYAYRGPSFSLNRARDNEQKKAAIEHLLKNSADQNQPFTLDRLTVTVRNYNYHACSLLTREWARSVCYNPWSPIRQALPENRFTLIDLKKWTTNSSQGPRCANHDKPPQQLPIETMSTILLCSAEVAGGDEDEFHIAVVRINGDLGAIWTVWRFGPNGETAEAMSEREGKAIVSFVRYALGPVENYSALLEDLCRLRRPGSINGTKGATCSPPDQHLNVQTLTMMK